MTNKEAIEELKKVDTLDMPARLCEAHYMAIKALEQEPKAGHWIDMDEGFSPCECSECGSVEFIKSKYCPNCGCAMKGE